VRRDGEFGTHFQMQEDARKLIRQRVSFFVVGIGVMAALERTRDNPLDIRFVNR
jgi:hypothetical protein